MNGSSLTGVQADSCGFSKFVSIQTCRMKSKEGISNSATLCAIALELVDTFLK